MKESILDVLLYLFEHYFTNDAFDHPGDDLTAQNGPLVGELTEAGFSVAEIRKAFDWLDALARQRPAPGQPRVGGPTRVFHGAEDIFTRKLGGAARRGIVVHMRHNHLGQQCRDMIGEKIQRRFSAPVVLLFLRLCAVVRVSREARRSRVQCAQRKFRQYYCRFDG